VRVAVAADEPRQPRDRAGRVAAPSGCEVDCVAYGDNTLAPTIYFSGNGMGRDYYFNDGNPVQQNSRI